MILRGVNRMAHGLLPKRCQQQRGFACSAFDFDTHIVDFRNTKAHPLPSAVAASGTTSEPSFGFTEPFRLLSPAALDVINSTLDCPRVQQNCFVQPDSGIASCVARNVHEESGFIADMFKDRRLAEALSLLTGEAITPTPLKSEIAHFNIQVPSDDPGRPVFDWHTDSQPFVLIVDVSRPGGAVNGSRRGGATLVDVGDSVYELKFPEPGWAYLLKGSELPHAASRAENYERRTMITAFQYADCLKPDRSDLGLNIEYSPDRNKLKEEYVGFRLQRLQDQALALQRSYHTASHEEIDIAAALIQEELETVRKSLKLLSLKEQQR